MSAGAPADREPLLWQLRDPARVIDLRPAAPPTPLLMTATRPGPELACPVFLGRADDPEASTVQAALRALGVASLRVPAENADIGLRLTADGICFQAGEHAVTATVLWVRHFSARAVRLPASSARNLFRSDSWRALVGQLSSQAGTAVLGTGPGLLAQLATAREAGIRVPATVVTTRPAADAGRIPASRIVVKALDSHAVEASPGVLAGVFAQVVTQETAARWQDSGGVPVVLQEYVAHESEWRVYFLRGKVHSFEVSKDSPEAPWLGPRPVRVVERRGPAAVTAAARAMAAGLATSYAAFDFLLSEGEAVLLEANPDGDWRWFEARAASRSVTMSATGMVARLHRGARSADGRPARRADRLALPLFLAGGRRFRPAGPPAGLPR